MPNSNLIVQIIDVIEFGENLGSPIEDRTADADWDMLVKPLDTVTPPEMSPRAWGAPHMAGQEAEVEADARTRGRFKKDTPPIL